MAVNERNIQLISRINTQANDTAAKKTSESTTSKIKGLIRKIPIPRNSEKFPQVKILLILVAIERFALYSIINFQLNLTDTGLVGEVCHRKNWTGQEDSVLTYAFSFLFAPIAGLLADWKFGRHRVFSFGLLLQFIGYSALGILFSNQLFNNSTECSVFYVFYYLSLLTIVIGCSCFNAVIIPYGVDQMREASVITTIPSYFHWYYFSINLGSFLALGGLSHYENTLQDRLMIISNVFVAIILSFIALIVFKIQSMIGWLIPTPSQGNPVAKIYKVVLNAINNRIDRNKQIDLYQKKKPLLDYAKFSNGGKFTFEQVEDVKTFFSMLLVLFSLTWYYLQDFLDVHLFVLQGDGFFYDYRSLVPIYISKFGAITSMIAIIILEYTNLGRKFYRVLPRILHRFIIGFPLATLGILFATILEYVHKSPCIAASIHSNASSVKLTTHHYYLVYLQLFQYGFLSISEVIVTVGSIEWVYAQSPEYLRAFTYGLFESVIGLGTLLPFISSIALKFLTCGYAEDGDWCLNCWTYTPICVTNHYCYSTYYFFTVILVVSLLSVVTFLLIGCWYKPRMRQRLRGFHSLSATNRFLPESSL